MERRRVSAILLVSVETAAAGLAADPVPPVAPASISKDGGWPVKAVTSCSTAGRRPSSSLKEFKGVGEIAAPTRAVHRVLDDVNGYPSFMPFTVECRILKREGESVLTYQRLSPRS